jgi:hypothetical protein
MCLICLSDVSVCLTLSQPVMDIDTPAPDVGYSWLEARQERCNRLPDGSTAAATKVRCRSAVLIFVANVQADFL